MRIPVFALIWMQLVGPCVQNSLYADDFADAARGGGASLGIGGAVVLADPSVAYYETLLHTNPIRGGFGESHMTQFLSRYVREAGGLEPFSARIGPQGIDGGFVRFGRDGQPVDLVIGEAKYGSSKLGMTKDGIQMGEGWRKVKLVGLSENYRDVSRQSRNGLVRAEPLDVRANPQRLELRMSDGKAAVYWRRNASEHWKFAGRESQLTAAGERAGRLGDFLAECASERRAYKAYIWRVDVRGNEIRWIAKDATLLRSNGTESGLPVLKSGSLKLDGAELHSLKRLGTNEIADLIRKKEPMLTVTESRQIASKISDESRSLQHTLTADASRAEWRLLRMSAAAGLIAATIDMSLSAAVDYWNTGKIHADLVAKRGGIALAAGSGGAYVGQKVTVAVLKSAAANSARGVGGPVSTTMFGAQGAGIAAGGAVASVVMAYGSYFAGLTDLHGANVMATAGVAGGLAGAAAWTGTLSLIAAYGTASTGTAIATLSGAAAANASLAVLGGGTVAAGGLGVAGGAVVLSGGVLLVVVGVGAAVASGFSYFDEREDMRRIYLTVERLAYKKHLVPAM